MTTPLRGACPFCALRLRGSPEECPRCGTLLAVPSEGIRRLAERERALLRTRKAASDTLFLVGLLLGGPLITVGDHFRIGSFVVLAASIAAFLRRYTWWSLAGTIGVGSLASLVVAALLVEPVHQAFERGRAGAEARRAYAAALNDLHPEITVEERGAEALVVWFTLPAEQAAECGTYPPPEIRAHLAALGFLRVVVRERNQAGGLCSFVP